MLTLSITNGNLQIKSKRIVQWLHTASIVLTRLPPDSCMFRPPYGASVSHGLRPVHTDWFYGQWRSNASWIKQAVLPSLVLLGQRSRNALEKEVGISHPTLSLLRDLFWKGYSTEYAYVVLTQDILAQMEWSLHPIHVAHRVLSWETNGCSST